MNREHLSAGILIGLIVLLAACMPYIPATTPPQLQHTPGAFVVVDEHIYDAGVFRVAYPAGWRIVKSSIASAEMEVVFVSPDDAMSIQVYPGDCMIPQTVPDAAWVKRYEKAANVCLYGRAPIEHEAEFNQIFEQMRASVE